MEKAGGSAPGLFEAPFVQRRTPIQPPFAA